MTKGWTSTSSIAVTACFLIAATPLTTLAQDEATELRVAVADFAGEIMDPVDGGFGSLIWHAPMFDFLVHLDENRQLVPGLAESWDISEDGLSYVFHLRDGLTFHNGEPLTSDDVVAHFERLAEMGTGTLSGPLTSAIEVVEAIDELTVGFTLAEANPDFLAYLAPSDTSVGAIPPHDYLEEVGVEGFREAPVGSGPWAMVERETNSYVLFEAQDHPYRPHPGFDRLRMMLVPEESARIAMLGRGEADIIDVSIDGASQLRDDGGTVWAIPQAYISFISFIGAWTDDAAGQPTADVRVREALSMAIDREELLEFMLAGEGSIASVFAFPTGAAYDEAFAQAHQIEFDPAGAEALLAEAGYGDGFELTLYSIPLVGASWMLRANEIIADYWSRIGVDVEVVSTEWGTVSPLIYGRPAEAVGSAYNLRTGNSSFWVGKIQNYMSAAGERQVANIDWTDRYQEVASETDPAERERLLQAIVNDFAETHTMLPLFYMNALFGASDRVEGFRPVQGWPRLELSYEYMQPSGQ